MNKRQLEAMERAKLKYMLDSKPKLKEIIDGIIENPNPELQDVIEPVIKEVVNKAENRGILIGWNTFAICAIENIKKMETIEEVKDYFEQEHNKMIEKLNLESKNVGNNNNNQGE